MNDVEQIAAQEKAMNAPDRYSIRLLPYEGGITGIWDDAIKKYYGEGGQLLRFAEQANAIDYLAAIQRTQGIPEAVIFTTPNGSAYHPGDHLLASFDADTKVSMVIDRVDEDDVWYTMPSVPEQEPVSMERTVFERHMDQGNITVVPAEQAIAAEKSEPVAETSAAAYTETLYKVGDTVYLDDTLFEITEVGDYNVQLRDPALAYPIFRAESKAQFERLLQQDYRNGGITEFLPAELDITDTDLLDVLTGEGGLLDARDILTRNSKQFKRKQPPNGIIKKPLFRRLDYHAPKQNTVAIFLLSKLPVGSSARISLGLVIKARPIATRCCWPPDSWLGKWCRRSARPKSSKISSTAAGSGLR